MPSLTKILLNQERSIATTTVKSPGRSSRGIVENVVNKVTEQINVRKTRIVKRLDVVIYVSRLDIFHRIVLTKLIILTIVIIRTRQHL
jgi:hypothetical protein